MTQNDEIGDDATTNAPAAGELLVLRTGLFPSADVLSAGLDSLPASTAVKHIDLRTELSSAQDWDNVLDSVLGANKIITL